MNGMIWQLRKLEKKFDIGGFLYSVCVCCYVVLDLEFSDEVVESEEMNMGKYIFECFIYSFSCNFGVRF